VGGIFIYLTAVSRSAYLFPVSCENGYSAYKVNPPLYKPTISAHVF
jgi:hypothetical protein